MSGDCQHDDTFNGVCVWCRAVPGDEPTLDQARIVGDLVREESPQAVPTEGFYGD